MYILHISPLLGLCFANIFSQSLACIFIFFTVSFKEKHFLIWMKSKYQQDRGAGGLQIMGLQKVEHDSVSEHTHTH